MRGCANQSARMAAVCGANLVTLAQQHDDSGGVVTTQCKYQVAGIESAVRGSKYSIATHYCGLGAD